MGCIMTEVVENGIIYVVETYDNGIVVKSPKFKGTPPETPIQIARKILQAGDKAELLSTAQGRALAAILKILIDL